MSTSSLAGLRLSGTTSTCWGWVSHSDGKKSNWSHDEEEMKILATVRRHCCKWWEVFLFAVGDTLGARRQNPYGFGKLSHRKVATIGEEGLTDGSFRSDLKPECGYSCRLTASDWSRQIATNAWDDPPSRPHHQWIFHMNPHWTVVKQYSAKKKSFTSNCNGPVQK